MTNILLVTEDGLYCRYEWWFHFDEDELL